MTIFQIPAARHIPTYGYKRFLLLGWAARTVFIFCIGILPLLEFLDHPTRIALLLLSLFFFNLLRGISSGAWLPWITGLVPETHRTRYLSIDGILLHVGGFVAFMLSGLLLGSAAEPWKFSVVFLGSAAAATASLGFVRRISEVAARDALMRSGQLVPWREIIHYPPFFKLSCFTVIFTLVVGSFGVFSVAWLRGVAGMAEGPILSPCSLGFLAAISTYPLVRARLKHSGGRRLLRFALCLMSALLGAWMLGAAKFLPPTATVIAVLSLGWGFASAHFNLAHAQLMMNTMPEMGRNHFFAFFSVILSLGLGLAPLLWGLILDALGPFRVAVGSAEINRYTCYFAALAGLCLVGALYGKRLEENSPLAAPETNLKAAAIHAGLRRLGRLWYR